MISHVVWSHSGSDISSVLQVNGDFVHSESSHGNEWGARLNIEYLW